MRFVCVCRCGFLLREWERLTGPVNEEGGLVFYTVPSIVITSAWVSEAHDHWNRHLVVYACAVRSAVGMVSVDCLSASFQVGAEHIVSVERRRCD